MTSKVEGLSCSKYLGILAGLKFPQKSYYRGRVCLFVCFVNELILT